MFSSKIIFLSFLERKSLTEILKVLKPILEISRVSICSF